MTIAKNIRKMVNNIGIWLLKYHLKWAKYLSIIILKVAKLMYNIILWLQYGWSKPNYLCDVVKVGQLGCWLCCC